MTDTNTGGLLAAIKCADFVFLARFASTEERRHYLNGVCVQPVPRCDGVAWAVATDGHRLGVLRIEGADGFAVPGMGKAGADAGSGLILSTSGLLKMAKADAKRGFLLLYADGVEICDGWKPGQDGAHEIGAIVAIVPAAVAYIDGTFPDWQRIVPADCPAADAASYNARYLADFEAPGNKYGGPVMVRGPAAGPALVANTDPRFLGVLMPYRDGRADPKARRAAVLDTGLDKPADATERAAAAQRCAELAGEAP